MIRQNSNVFSVILDDEAQNASALPAVGTVVTSANLAKGAVVLTDLGLRRLDYNTTAGANYAGLANGAGFLIVQGKGTTKPLMKSPRLTKGSVTITTSKHKAALQQITTIGYNGTTGSLPVANDTAFFIKIRKNDNDAANRSQPMSLFAQFKTDATGTQEELAFGLMSNGIKNFADEPANGYIRFEVISDGTAAVVSDGTQTQDAVVVKGSKVITLVDTGTSTAGNTAGIAAAIPVGSYLFINGATYKVAALNANAVTLNIAYQGESGTITGGTTYASTFGELTAISNWGIRITGVEAPFDVNKFRNYYANRFTATFSDESTLVSHTQGARNGNGVWQQVAMDEYMSYGFEGQNEMLAVPATMRDQEVKIPGVGTATAATSKYSVLSLAWDETVSGIVHSSAQKGQVICYLNLDASANLGTSGSTGEALAVSLGVTAADLDE